MFDVKVSDDGKGVEASSPWGVYTFLFGQTQHDPQAKIIGVEFKPQRDGYDSVSSASAYTKDGILFVAPEGRGQNTALTLWKRN